MGLAGVWKSDVWGLLCCGLICCVCVVFFLCLQEVKNGCRKYKNVGFAVWLRGGGKFFLI